MPITVVENQSKMSHLQMSFVILDRLGEVGFGMFKLKELGETSFGI